MLATGNLERRLRSNPIATRGVQVIEEQAKGPASDSAEAGETTGHEGRDADQASDANETLSEDPKAIERRLERQLVRRLKLGDERAFQEFVRQYQDRIFGLIFRLIGNRHEAEDLAQDVFISVHRHIHSYRQESRLYTWLFRIATNACKNRQKYLRGRAFHLRVGYDEKPEAPVARDESGNGYLLHAPLPSPEAAAAGNHLSRAISRELSELPEEQRILIVLRDVEGLAYDEICRITGLVEGTLKSRLHRARLALKGRLSKEFAE